MATSSNIVFVGHLSCASKVVRQTNHCARGLLSFRGKRVQAIIKVPLTGTIRFTGILARHILRVFKTIATLQGTLIRAKGITRIFVSRTILSGHLRHGVGKRLSSAFHFRGNLRRSSHKFFVATVNLDGYFMKSMNESLRAMMTFSTSWHKGISLHLLLSSRLRFAGDIRGHTYHVIKAVLAFAGRVNKGRRVVMSSSISFAGRLLHGPATLIVMSASRAIKRFRTDTDRAVLIEDTEREHEPYQQHPPK